MSALASVKECMSQITVQLRWVSSAVALVNRPDRTDALLNRWEKLDERLDVVERSYVQFNSCLLDLPLGSLSQEQIERAHADYEQIMELADTIAQESKRVLRLRGTDQSSPDKIGSCPTGLLSRLPTLDLPHFDGKLENWLSFMNLFESLVEARSDLRPAQKLAYLLSVLEGEARGIVQHLQINDNNYQTARDLLARRFQNHRRLADTHIEQILNLPNVRNATGLRNNLLNPLLIAVNALRKLNLPVDHWSYLLVHIVLKKLPSELRARFEQKYGGDSASHLPPFDDLEKFLEDECRMSDNSGVLQTVGSQPPRPRDQGRMKARGTPEGRFPPRFAAARVQSECAYCKVMGHSISNCKSFVNLHVASRRRIANVRRLCFSCLGNHFQRDCPNPRPCPNCGGGHLALLCANSNGIGRESPTGGYVASGRRDDARILKSRSSPSVGSDRGANGRSAPPPRGTDYAAAARRQSPRHYRMPSPPLAERPRLESRPPRFGRVTNYELPPMARRPGHRAFEEFELYPRLERPAPGCGDRSPPRRH